MNRRELRTHIFRLLFEIEFRDISEMPELIRLYLDLLDEVSVEDEYYITSKTMNIINKIEEFDEKINEVAVGWKTSRMNKVDLAILRLANYEIFCDEDVPDGVAVNEAVELSKKYSTVESSAFVNGILSSIIKKFKKPTSISQTSQNA